MKSNKSKLDNPVLNFSSSVAGDLIGKKIDGHFQKAFKGLENYEKEMHLGMLLAMKSDRQPADVRARLILNNQINIKKVSGLVKRYVLILDNETRRADFLEGRKNFWQASTKTQGTIRGRDRYETLLHYLVITCEKQNITNQEHFNDFSAYRDQYRQERGW